MLFFTIAVLPKAPAIENKISFSRQFYNDTVTMYNTKLQIFPSNIIAGMFNFTSRDLFKTDDEARKNVKVDFGG